MTTTDATTEAVVCRSCGRPFDGSRAEARRAGWDPYSHKTQQAIDHGPLVCPSCMMSALDGALDAMRSWAHSPATKNDQEVNR